jgi:hypothetical protein
MRQVSPVCPVQMNGRDDRSTNDVERTRGYNASMSELWHLLESRTADAAMNMAVDEALLRTAAERGRSLLRAYSWLRPAISIGYFQKFPAPFAERYEIVRPTTAEGILHLLSSGLITGIVDDDATGIGGYSIAGSRFGYNLLWTLTLASIALGICGEMSARLGAVTGKGLGEVIRERFPTEWIMAPFPQSTIADDIELTLPECDLYLSYVRHPDVALAIIEEQKPVILGVSFGPGFLRQAKTINENIVAPVTMCSLEDNTWVPAINEFAKVFGRPSFDVKVQEDGTIESVRVIRGSPCGSTMAASGELPGTRLTPGQLQHYGLRICHFCRAPRFGKTCDKEISGLLHIRELIHAISAVSPVAGARVKSFADEMEKMIEQKITKG